MQIELVKLLANRLIRHPGQIERFYWSGDGLHIGIRGYPWWLDAEADHDATGKIEFHFRNIFDGVIRPEGIDFDSDEILEDFDVSSSKQVGWTQPAAWSIYCSGPIPDPLRLYRRLNDFLSQEASFRRPDDFLNGASTISGFEQLCSERSFLLAQGPDCIRELLCDELKAQSVSFSEVRTLIPQQKAYLVRFGDSSFLCRDAVAEFSQE